MEPLVCSYCLYYGEIVERPTLKHLHSHPVTAEEVTR